MWGTFLDIGHYSRNTKFFTSKLWSYITYFLYGIEYRSRNKIGKFYKIIGPAPLIELLATTWGEIIDNQNFDKKLVY